MSKKIKESRVLSSGFAIGTTQERVRTIDDKADVPDGAVVLDPSDPTPEHGWQRVPPPAPTPTPDN